MRNEARVDVPQMCRLPVVYSVGSIEKHRWLGLLLLLLLVRLTGSLFAATVGALLATAVCGISGVARLGAAAGRLWHKWRLVERVLLRRVHLHQHHKRRRRAVSVAVAIAFNVAVDALYCWLLSGREHWRECDGGLTCVLLPIEWQLVAGRGEETRAESRGGLRGT